jgi:SNF2 family DNA or RNA helicase
MPRIFDNIENSLLPALTDALGVSHRSDFCVGYFNLRGWNTLCTCIENWPGGEGNQCRLLVGMQRLPQEELRQAYSLVEKAEGIDQATVIRLKKKLAAEFREQLTYGIPTNADEAGLRRLASQLKAGKVSVKLYLRHPLHAKLYLCFRSDTINPIIGYLGSSNLTLSGLSHQGELNIDVLDHDAAAKLSNWFNDRWDDRWCIDITDELIQIIEESWAREDLIPPYHIYIKMAYHLSQEAREGLSEFRIPREFQDVLFEFQSAAVKIAAHHLHKRNGVLIGDVVGLGKTLMATALARIFEDDFGMRTLIICPKNLTPMWDDYRERFGLRGKVMSISRALRDLPNERRFQLVLIDESHNLRNREGKTYKAIQDYIKDNDSKCILLTATPYNKTYIDLSNQLRLFIDENRDIGIRPEKLLREISETVFLRRHQCSPRSLAAFEKSDYTDDWRELMRLYLIRRTRSFILDNYAKTDSADGRKYLEFHGGESAYFPIRQPKTLRFTLDEQNPDDQYARLYSEDVVHTINNLNLPRYGLGNYIATNSSSLSTPNEQRQIQDLSRAGKRLMGFCRTNLFKRLESSGVAFLQSVERHILRNYIYLHAIENNLPLPIGTQDAELLDPSFFDEDKDTASQSLFGGDDTNDNDDDDNGNGAQSQGSFRFMRTESEFQARAAAVYGEYQSRLKKRFKWLRSDLFVADLKSNLTSDAQHLLSVLEKCSDWQPRQDSKLQTLIHLLAKKHSQDKVLIFSQFADTVRYLDAQLRSHGVQKTAAVWSGTSNPTDIVWRFSPANNQKRDRIKETDELRVLLATDILSEGQNLQDCAIVINYDLPWAIIRLIQRAGRIDRIGQQATGILCYSFLPAEGVERIIRLRSRVRQRLQENAEVVGSDEAFFEDQDENTSLNHLYNERAGILDDDQDTEVDLASKAYQIWKNAIDADATLRSKIERLPEVVFSTRAHAAVPNRPEGVLVYLKTAEGNDALAYLSKDETSITESQYEILQAAACAPETPAIAHHEMHHGLVHKAVEHIVREEKNIGGQLGSPRGARFRTYERLKCYLDEIKGTIFEYGAEELRRAIDEIYRYPLRQTAIDALNRQLKAGIDDSQLAELVHMLRREDRLCIIHDEAEIQEPRIICSMGLFDKQT